MSKELHAAPPRWPWVLFGLFFLLFGGSLLYSAHYRDGQPSAAQLNPSELDKIIKSPDLQLANVLYQSRCAVCHGELLQGRSGPNLTDAYWIYGKGTATEIIHILRVGVITKGMPAWENVLQETEMAQLTALILTKQDSNPPGAKAPQGVKTR